MVINNIVNVTIPILTRNKRNTSKLYNTREPTNIILCNYNDVLL